MIKKLTFILLAAGCTQIMYAQSTEKNEKFLENKTLFEELTNVKKKQDKFNLFLNMQGSFDANFRDGFEEGAFKMRQLRIEAKRKYQQLAFVPIQATAEPLERQ